MEASIIEKQGRGVIIIRGADDGGRGGSEAFGSELCFVVFKGRSSSIYDRVELFRAEHALKFQQLSGHLPWMTSS